MTIKIPLKIRLEESGDRYYDSYEEKVTGENGYTLTVISPECYYPFQVTNEMVIQLFRNGYLEIDLDLNLKNINKERVYKEFELKIDNRDKSINHHEAINKEISTLMEDGWVPCKKQESLWASETITGIRRSWCGDGYSYYKIGMERWV